MDARKFIWPLLKSLRRDYPKSKINIVFPAKLVKDGQVVSDRFPRWGSVLHEKHEPQRMTPHNDNHIKSTPANQPTASSGTNQSQQSQHRPTVDSRSRASTHVIAHERRVLSPSPARGRHHRRHAPLRHGATRTQLQDNTRALPSGADPSGQFNRPWATNSTAAVSASSSK